MAYRLEVEQEEHRVLVTSFLRQLSSSSPDLTLLPTEGPAVSTMALPLSLHSPTLATLLTSLASREGLVLSVPATSSSLTLLLRLLSTGLVVAATREELEEVQEAAAVLGIDLRRCRMGSKASGEEEVYTMEEVDLSALASLPVQVVEEGATASTELSCKKCRKDFKRRDLLKRHMLSHNSISFACCHCSEEFSDNGNLAKHMVGTHGLKTEIPTSEDTYHLGVKFGCDQCTKIFSRKDKLSAHLMKWHKKVEEEDDALHCNGPEVEDSEESEEKPFGCSDCPKSFKHATHLGRHKASVHSRVAIICDECGKQFSRRDKLNMHIKTLHKFNADGIH